MQAKYLLWGKNQTLWAFHLHSIYGSNAKDGRGTVIVLSANPLEAIGKLEEKTTAKLTSLPVIILGMASDNTGMKIFLIRDSP